MKLDDWLLFLRDCILVPALQFGLGAVVGYLWGRADGMRAARKILGLGFRSRRDHEEAPR